MEIEISDRLIDAVQNSKQVTGSTHDFYNYPARFSPSFPTAVIDKYSNPGDLILDPFMGGGTTLVSAKLLGRQAIGFDVSTLARFLAEVKLNPITMKDWTVIAQKVIPKIDDLKCHLPHSRPKDWITKGYHRNLSTRSTWHIRKVLEMFLDHVDTLQATVRLKKFLRCCVLKTAQWALDSRLKIPSAKQFRSRLRQNIELMAGESLMVAESYEKAGAPKAWAVNQKAENMSKVFSSRKLQAPKLIVTSPPYPGVHVLYHRWQIFGRKETPAPFWIANCLDGAGLSYYTMGSRQQKGLTGYFDSIYRSFRGIRSVCKPDTIIFQMIGFSQPEWQLPKYLHVMEQAGFSEVLSSDRIWRDVPNRKWHANYKGSTASSREVVLIHRLS